MAESMKEKLQAKKHLASKAVLWGIGIPVVLAVVLFSASFFLDEPLRSITEKRMNRSLKGYSVRLSQAHLQLPGFSITLKGLTVLQEAHPDPPVAYFPVVKATIHWREILSGRLVAELVLDRPQIHINLQQLHSEAASTVSLKERGWQQALEAVYPLKMNKLKITDANVTYSDQDPKHPLILSHLNLTAANIRNIHLPDQVYPSSFHLDTAIFNTGRGTVDGNANFLAEPHPGIKAHFKLENISIDSFGPLVARSNISIHGGVLRASGDAEYAPKLKIAHLDTLAIQGMKLDYIHSQRTDSAEKKRIAIAEKTAKKLSNNPDLVLYADQVSLIGCTLGMVNKAARKPYRIFLADTDLHLSNFSNQFVRGAAQAQLQANFMGSGRTTASATFRPGKKGPDFNLSLKIGQTRLTAMNDLLRSYGDFDVSAGVFSLVTELQVKNGSISGYIKPFIKDMKVYDRRMDKKKGVGHQMYEMLIGGVATILENRSHQEVATKFDITGPVQKPETSSWQIIAELFRNAFFKAILPGFEKEATGAVKH